jgi:sigma-E factor negative regulatory protein RseC
MDATGVVRELRGQKAIVLVKRQSACDACASGASCRGAEHGAELEAFNAVGAEPGDEVRISFRALTYLKGSLLVYGIPAVALIAGAVAGKELAAAWWPLADADLVSALAAFGFMGVAVFFVRLLIRKFERKSELTPVIEEIIGHQTEVGSRK